MSAHGVLRVLEGGEVAFWCPGCREAHQVQVSASRGNWKFDGNYERPTFSPSVLVTGRRFTENGRAQWRAWCDSGHPKPWPKFDAEDLRCHSFVKDGQIQFLSDCSHSLRGKTVPLEPF